MKFVLELNLDNAAFDSACGVAICNGPLTELIERMPTNPKPGWSMKLRDVNGNTIGEARIEE